MELTMLMRTIPRSGEALPVIGLGTWQTFDVGTSEAERAPLRDVLTTFLDRGGRVIDSSPMYGRSERVVGELLAELGRTDEAFLATKVWISGKAQGEQQMRTSLRLLGRERLDLMQVHNLLDVDTHLATLRAWKRDGIFRYLGVTHYARGAFGQLERLVREEAVDFVQLPYSVVTREVEERLLPAAQETGTAVLVMRPLESGELMRRVRGKPLPAWAAELDCTSWAQLLLKFVIGHPAVTAPIPATASHAHLVDDLAAGSGRLPDAEMRQKLARLADSL
jgi:aryl-alcohol dehydrogenase-like predicted oxidoreductase